MPPDAQPAVLPSLSKPAEADPAFQTGGVITVSSSHAVHDTYTSFLSPLLPLIIANLSLTKTLAGLLTVFYQGPSILQPFIGLWADRTNLRMLVILAPAITGAMLSLVGAAPSYPVLALLLLVAGFSSAGLHSVGPVMAGVLAGKNLGRAMSFWMVGGELARTIGPVIVVAGVSLLTPRGLPALMLGGIAASTFLYIRLRNAPDYRPPAHSSLDWAPALRLLRPILLPLAAVIAARALLASAISTFLPTMLTEEGAKLWIAGGSLSLFEAAGVLGALAGGSLSDRLGRRRVLVIMSLTAPLAALLFLAAQGWARVPALMILGLTLLSTTPVLMAMAQERAPGSRALANGIYMALNFVISSLAVVIVGVLADRFGLRTTLTASAVVMLAGLPFAILLPDKKSSTTQ